MKRCFVRTQHEKGNFWSVDMEHAKGDIVDGDIDDSNGMLLKLVHSKVKRRSSAPAAPLAGRVAKVQRRSGFPRGHKIKSEKQGSNQMSETVANASRGKFSSGMRSPALPEGVEDAPGKRSVEVQTDITTISMMPTTMMKRQSSSDPSQPFMSSSGPGPSAGMMNMFAKQHNPHEQQDHFSSQFQPYPIEEQSDGVSQIVFRAPRMQQQQRWSHLQPTDQKAARSNFSLDGFTYPGELESRVAVLIVLRSPRPCPSQPRGYRRRTRARAWRMMYA